MNATVLQDSRRKQQASFADLNMLAKISNKMFFRAGTRLGTPASKDDRPQKQDETMAMLSESTSCGTGAENKTAAELFEGARFGGIARGGEGKH